MGLAVALAVARNGWQGRCGAQLWIWLFKLEAPADVRAQVAEAAAGDVVDVVV